MLRIKSYMCKIAGSVLIFAGFATTAYSQSSEEEKAQAKAIAEWKAMLEEGNPAELYEAKGEDLWKKPRGPKNVALAGECDLGQGKGVIKGAFATLPRYFKDTNKVQDLESRLMTCMETIQGIDSQSIINGQFQKGERATMEALVTYIAAASKGMPLNLPQSHPQEKQMYKTGKQLFFFRGGPYDFSCATCHGQEGKRIRASSLPDLTKNKETGEAFSAWPAYRVSNSQMWTPQQRWNDCLRQQRMPEPIYGSEATIALATYLGVTGKGVKSVAPGIKR